MAAAFALAEGCVLGTIATGFHRHGLATLGVVVGRNGATTLPSMPSFGALPKLNALPLQ